MPDSPHILAAALAALMLASCGSRAPTAAENEAADAMPNALENASPSEPGQANVSDRPSPDSVPPPDAVSHPDGYLPDATDLPPAAGAEPTAPDPPGAKEPPPATEDQYIRNKQSGS